MRVVKTPLMMNEVAVAPLEMGFVGELLVIMAVLVANIEYSLKDGAQASFDELDGWPMTEGLTMADQSARRIPAPETARVSMKSARMTRDFIIAESRARGVL